MPFLTNFYALIPPPFTYDELYGAVVALLHGDGTPGSAAMVDSSQYRRTVTPTLSTISSVQSKFGGTSMMFSAAGHMVQMPNAPELNPVGDFTVECWLYLTAIVAADRVIAFKASGTGHRPYSLQLTTTGYLRAVASNAAGTTFPVDITGNTILTAGWNHVALAREGSNWRLFVNGIMQTAVGTLAGPAYVNAGPLVIGNDSSTAYPLSSGGTAYIDDFRVTNGYARYTSSFNIPASAYPDISIQNPEYDDLLGHVALLYKAEGANGLTVHADSSPTPKAITNNGGAAISTAQKLFGISSASFNGTNAWLQAARDPLFDFGTGDFTLECAVYQNSITSPVAYQMVLVRQKDTGPNIALQVSMQSGVPAVALRAASGGTVLSITGPSALPATTWHRLAVSRVNGIVYLFANGILQGSVACAYDFSDSTKGFVIGASDGNSPGTGNWVNGYVDEVRVTYGFGRYQGTYSPSPYPLNENWNPYDLYLPQTSLLLHGAGAEAGIIIDDVRGKPIALAGNAQTTLLNAKFPSGSIVLDGTGDYLTTPGHAGFNFGAGDFTIEMWVRPANVTAGNKDLFGQYSASLPSGVCLQQRAAKVHLLVSFNGSAWGIDAASAADVFAAGVWAHVALVRASGTFTIYINGVSVLTNATAGTASYLAANSIRIGASPTPSNYYVGNLAEIRVTRGVARYKKSFYLRPTRFPDTYPVDSVDSQTVSLLHFNGPDAATSFSDDKGRVWSAVGNAKLSTASAKFGGAALVVDGTGDSITTPDSSDFDFGAGDWTISMFAKAAAFVSYASLLTKRLNGTLYCPVVIQLQNTGAGRVRATVSNNGTTWGVQIDPVSASQMVVGTWHHIAVTREGSLISLWFDGNLAGTGTITGSLFANTAPLCLGGNADGSESFNGQIDEVQLVKGKALYTGSSYVVPLRSFGRTPMPTNIMDVLGREGTAVLWGNAHAQTGANATHPAATGPRLYVDHWVEPTGVPSGVQIPVEDAANPLNFSTGDFTIAFWVYAIQAPDADGYAMLDVGGGYNYSWPNIRLHASSTTGLAIALRSTSVDDDTAPDIANFVTTTTQGGLTAGTWTHIALTRQGSVFRLFKNGVQAWTVTSALALKVTGLSSPLSGFNLGCTGYDIRTGGPSFALRAYYAGMIATNTCLYSGTFTPPPRPIEVASKPIDMKFDTGNGSTSFVDEGAAASVWSIGAGAITCSTGTILEGVSSLNIPSGGTAYLTAPASLSNILPATKDFVLKFKARASSWLRPDTAGCTFLSIQGAAGTAAVCQFAIASNSSQYPAIVYCDGTNRLVATGTVAIPINTNLDFEFRRSGTNLSLYINGTLYISVTFTAAFNQITSEPWRIGCPAGATGGPTNGMIFDSFSLVVA